MKLMSIDYQLIYSKLWFSFIWNVEEQFPLGGPAHSGFTDFSSFQLSEMSLIFRLFTLMVVPMELNWQIVDARRKCYVIFFLNFDFKQIELILIFLI